MLALLAALFASASLAGEPSATSSSQAPQAVSGKLGQILSQLESDFRAYVVQHGPGSEQSFRPRQRILRVTDGFVLVDLVAAANPQTLRADLLALGARRISVHKSMVSAQVPIASLGEVGQLASLQFGRASMFITWSGATTSQGDVAQRSAAARTAFGVDGTGITVGVLSDSYNCQGGAAADIGSGDLPGSVTVLQEGCPGSDEGRAMMQIVHDIAPGAALAFHSANGGQAAFANGIGALVTAGADVIVDDVFYFGEPMFQDGVIAQAADAAVGSGVAYFSSAGNAAAASYESVFRNSGQTGPFGGVLHDFDPGPAAVTAQPMTIPVGTTMTLIMQWDQPFASVSGAPGAGTELLVTLSASNGTTVLVSTTDSNLGGDPVDALEFTNDGTLPQGADTRFFLKIENLFGADPGLIKYIYVDSGGGVTIDQFDTQSGTSYGHSAAAGSMSTGAAAYHETPAFGVSPPLLEPFSSRGNVPIIFRTDGSAINPPELRLKPAIVAPDRVNTTFFGNDSDGDGFPNFAGTSAAAPHAAGVAALLLDFNVTLSPEQTYSAMADSAIDMLDAGYDFDSGAGLIQADTAIGALGNAAPVLGPISGRILGAGESASIPVSANDSDGPAPTLSAPVLPAFCSLSGTSGSGNVNCSPTSAHVGRHPVVITATDTGTPARSDSQGFYVVVTGTATNSAPVITPIADQSVDENASLSIPLSATDPNGDGMTFSATGLPAFCTLTNGASGSGTINCNPVTGNAGSYPVTVTVTDNGTPALDDSDPFTLTVNTVVANQAPVLAAIGNQSVDENASLAIPLSATDADGDSLSFGSTGLPAFCNLSDNLNGTASIACNPLTGDAGTYPTTVTVTDNGSPVLNDSETFDIVVTAPVVNSAPVLALIGNQSVDENASLSIPLSATDADGDSLTFGTTGLPAFCNLSDNLNGTASIACNPLTGDAGTYPTTVTVSDNGSPVLNDSETFNIVVNAGAANRAPRLSNIPDVSVPEGDTVVQAISATDRDGDNLTFSTTGLPAFCFLTDFGDGTGEISCSPGFVDSGIYSITVIVTDDGTPNLSASRTYNLTVTDVANTAPVLAAIGNQSVDENASLAIPLSATDADGDSLSFGSTGLPAFCNLSDNLNGTASIACNPLTGDAGTYPTTVTVTDNGSPVLNDSETFDIVVTAPVVNTAPVLAAIGNQSVDENASLAIPLSATDADGDSLSFGSTGLPAFCSLTDNLNGTGSLNCNPGSTDAGTYAATISVQDNGVPPLGDSETISIVVNNLNTAPVLAAIGNQSVDENASLAIPLSATDADGDELRLSQSNLPAFCSLTDNRDGTGRIDCSPDFGGSGTYSVTITVSDNGTPVQTDSETFNIVVNNVNAAPVLEPIGDQVVKENTTRVIAMVASDIDGNTLSFGAAGLPGFCNMTDAGNGNGAITCNPSGANAGAYLVTITVVDNGLPARSDSESFTINVAVRSTTDSKTNTSNSLWWSATGNGQSRLTLVNGAAVTIGVETNAADPVPEVVRRDRYIGSPNGNDISGASSRANTARRLPWRQRPQDASDVLVAPVKRHGDQDQKATNAE